MKQKNFLTLFTSLLVAFTLTPSLNREATINTQIGPDPLQSKNNQSAERKVIGYFQEWTYSLDKHDNYTADKLPWDRLTHINYAFAGVNANTYKIDFSNKSAAIEMEFPGQTANFPYKGHFNVLNSYKLKYPNVKTLISVGGGNGNVGFYTMTDSPATREIFADSCVDFIRTYGFNGIDLDFEYPTSTPLAGSTDDPSISESRRGVIYKNYVELVKLLRLKLDEASNKDNTKYLLSAAISSSSWVLGGMELGEYAPFLDYVNIMSYDFHGAWNGFVGHNAPLYPDTRDQETAQFPMPVLNIDWAVRYFRGVLPPEKINIGVPYYTRGWKDVQPGTAPGGLYGKAAKTDGGAIGEDNYWADVDWSTGKEIAGGVNPLWYAKNLLKKNDYKRYFDDVSKVPYIWNENKKVFLSFEDEESMKYKADYIVDKNLGGVLIWDIQGDFKQLQDGTYAMGDTLTTMLSDTFKKALPLKETSKPQMPKSKKFKVDFSGSYDHPNYTYDMLLTNNTNETIQKGWKLEFDMPKSAIMQTPWGVTIDKGIDKGDFIHYTISGPSWNDIPAGGNYKIQGMIKLCFTGGPQNFILNGSSSEYEQSQNSSIKLQAASNN
ncbi:glycosyl hydrolase family 18 protein [Clostridium gasigenes]|uniref:Chitinase C-terminal domain-containing protein n=1 Tax=Clostridium gasigenes TaxID=94869 RepID=A0A7X0VR35_9CLOT|nr:glycosyl hydrolase family 18 protein [Clostridium gasigenes]MBB6714959.1 chitinase C-terminal domain-containing protein [Clostridium gasigenes]